MIPAGEVAERCEVKRLVTVTIASSNDIDTDCVILQMHTEDGVDNYVLPRTDLGKLGARLCAMMAAW
jgi:hypothetical protein